MGAIERISGPLVVASGMLGTSMYDVVRVGNLGLIGEIIKLEGEKAVIQVYEDTNGLRPKEKVVSTESQLSVELGPGILSQIFDGVQRPLSLIKQKSGIFIGRGIAINAIDRKKKWQFHPEKKLKKGARIDAGAILGYVEETPLIKHYIMVPQGVSGKLASIKAGRFTVEEAIATIEDKGKMIKLKMLQNRPVRQAGKFAEKIAAEIPLVTGQRVIDTLFPVAKGGTAGIPGPFGAGKTVTLHNLAKFSDASIVVYIGCGERGNEMTEVLTEFPELKDPRTGRPLMERTVLIANTSNMPVAAREASVYTGITIAEYFRDMGYDVALMADSTSRWAEAMREISTRLEEMPGEEGYPAYLPKRIAEFYERAGRVKTLNGNIGSVTVVGAVSPPGGDLSEPVSQSTLRVVKTFWSLDAALASSRHFPAINWLSSYSLYLGALQKWYEENLAMGFTDARDRALKLLQKEAELKDIVQLVGEDALPDTERVLLAVGRLIRENFLRQSAFDEVDAFTSMKKQSLMLNLMLHFGDMANEAAEKGISAENVMALDVVKRLSRMKEIKEENIEKESKEMDAEMEVQFKKLIAEQGVIETKVKGK